MLIRGVGVARTSPIFPSLRYNEPAPGFRSGRERLYWALTERRVKVTTIGLMNMDDIAPSAPTAACKQTRACESEAGGAFPQNDSCAISKETQLSQLYVGQQMYVWKARFVSEMFS